MITGHGSIRDGSIALNAIQRRHGRVSTGDMVSVSRSFSLPQPSRLRRVRTFWFLKKKVCLVFCRFVPPENFELAMLTLELEFVKKGTKSEQVCC